MMRKKKNATIEFEASASFSSENPDGSSATKFVECRLKISQLSEPKVVFIIRQFYAGSI